MPLMHRSCHSGCNIYERIQKVLSEGTQLRQRFFVDERREDPNTTIASGPSSVRQRNLAGGPMMVQH